MSESLRRIVEVLGPESVSVLVDSTNRVTSAAHVLGVEITTEDVLQIESVKLACLADMPLDLVRALEQLREVPAVAARLKEKAEAAAVIDGHTAAINGLSRSEKISYARKHKLTGPQPETSKIGASEHRSIMAGLGASQKISYARRHGLEGSK